MMTMKTMNRARITSVLHIQDQDQADRMGLGFWDREEDTAVQTLDLRVPGGEDFRLVVRGDLMHHSTEDHLQGSVGRDLDLDRDQEVLEVLVLEVQEGRTFQCMVHHQECEVHRRQE